MSPECKVSQCIGLTNLLPSYSDGLVILATSTSWNPKGTVQACDQVALLLLMYAG